MQFVMQIVQIGVQAMHGGSPMQVTEEQRAALQASMANLEARDLQPRPMEYSQFGMHEPYHTIQKLISQLLGLTPSEVQEGVELVEQVSLPQGDHHHDENEGRTSWSSIHSRSAGESV